jgi:hypothetical protein
MENKIVDFYIILLHSNCIGYAKSNEKWIIIDGKSERMYT